MKVLVIFFNKNPLLLSVSTHTAYLLVAPSYPTSLHHINNFINPLLMKFVTQIIEKKHVGPFNILKKGDFEWTFVTNAMLYFNLIYMLFLFLALTSCSYVIHKSKDKADETSQITQRAIFQFLSLPNYWLDHLDGQGLTKIDPLLCVRDSIVINGKVYFDDQMKSDDLKYPLPKKSYQLIIPDSLSGKYRYTGSEDFGLDNAIIYQFSPPLPTKNSNIFLIEFYVWENACGDDTTCVRAINRSYIKVKIEKDKVIYIDDADATNKSDFYGFRSFSKRELKAY